MFTFLNDYNITQYISHNDFLKDVSLLKLKEENKKLKINILNEFIEYVEKQKEKDLFILITDVDMKFFKIHYFNFNSFFITCVYDNKESIFVLCIPEEIYSNKKNIENFIYYYKKYCIENLNVKKITLEINDYYNINENRMKNFNFKPALYYLIKTNFNIHKNLNNIHKVIFDENDNKIKYSNDSLVDTEELFKLYKNFLFEEEDHDKMNITGKMKDYKFKSAQEELKSIIKNNNNKMKNFYVYLNTDNKICGFSCGVYNKMNSDNYHISTLFVRKEDRGKGISTKLMEAHETFAKNNKIDEINISVLSGNDKAKDIYIKKHKYQIKRILFMSDE